MSDFQAYMNMQDRTKTAYSEYCNAGSKLTLAKINERLAEIKSQYEPIATLVGVDEREAPNTYSDYREKMYAAAYYVVRGRMPE